LLQRLDCVEYGRLNQISTFISRPGVYYGGTAFMGYVLP